MDHQYYTLDMEDVYYDEDLQCQGQETTEKSSNETDDRAEIPTCSKAEYDSDELLITLIKGYPHLYDKRNKNYKDAIMKENSWTEIARIMDWESKNIKTIIAHTYRIFQILILFTILFLYCAYPYLILVFCFQLGNAKIDGFVCVKNLPERTKY